jgi:hypothetical protein
MIPDSFAATRVWFGRALLIAGAPLLLGNLVGNLPAQELSADRPTFTPSPLVIPKGALQLEAGYTFADASNIEVHSLGEVLLRIGLTNEVEFRVGWLGYVWLDQFGSTISSGANDGTLGIKWSINRAGEKGGVDIGILAGTSVPIGDANISTGEWQPGASLVIGWGLTEWLSLTTSLGYAYQFVARRFDQGFISASFSAATSPRFSLFLEGYGFNKEQAGGSGSLLTNGGIVLALGKRWLLDARVGIGLGDSATDVFAGVGFVTAW